MYFKQRISYALAITAFITALAPATALACACGCGVFDVGTSSMLPTGEGGTAFVEYDFMNQHHNWHGASSAPSADNNDKDIKTNFYTAGAQYMFSRAWGAEVQVPYWDRHFTTFNGDSGSAVSFNNSALGDVRIRGIYSGFSPDMSSGVTFGLKLPTGDYSARGFDRDTQIGSGSTDLLLGAYHMGNLADMWNWFANAQLDQPVLITAGYRPGDEVDAVTGVYYDGWSIGNVKIAPVAQVVGSYRLQDRGMAANHDNSGYQRVLFSPGVEVDTAGFRIYGDVGVPVYQHVKGEQLIASTLYKLNISHSF